MVGLWSSNAPTGNLFGLFVSNLIIYQLDLRWESTMFLFSIFNLIFGLMVYYELETPESYSNTNGYIAIEGE